MISKDIIQALQRGLKKEQVWTDFLSYGSESGSASESRGKEMLMAMTEEMTAGDNWEGKDEVAHAVARHAAEQITKNLWFTIGQLILYQFVMPDLVNTMSNLLLKLPFSRRYAIIFWGVFYLKHSLDGC
ncbi:hypothetical protein HanOQP8_Chr01g0010701 [Helianthus annuus]|nr:hypothetical protein HanOQP8_Chr01g0010701 [Helianthus annuus]